MVYTFVSVSVLDLEGPDDGGDEGVERVGVAALAAQLDVPRAARGVAFQSKQCRVKGVKVWVQSEQHRFKGLRCGFEKQATYVQVPRRVCAGVCGCVCGRYSVARKIAAHILRN